MTSGDVPVPNTPFAFRLAVEFDDGGVPRAAQFALGAGEGDAWVRLPDHRPFHLGPGALAELDRHGVEAGADPLGRLAKLFQGDVHGD